MAPIRVVFENDDFGVVWKPRNVQTESLHAGQQQSAEELSADVLDLADGAVPLACHTLTASIEGLLVLAKTRQFQAQVTSTGGNTPRLSPPALTLRFTALAGGRMTALNCASAVLVSTVPLQPAAPPRL